MKNNLLRITQFVGDIVIIYLCFALTHGFVMHNSFSLNKDFVALLCLEITMVFFLYMFDMYKDRAVRREEIVVSVAMSSLAAIIFSFILSRMSISLYRSTYVFWRDLFLVMLFSLEVWRLLFSVMFIRFKKKERILIIESAAHSSSIARKIKYSHTNVNSAYYFMIDENAEDEVESLINNMLPQYDIIFISPNIEK